MTAASKAENMVAGRELDALVAERVMGWTRGPEKNPPNRTWPIASSRTWRAPDSHHARALPRYSTLIDDAWQVVAKMRADGFGFSLTDDQGETWTAEFWNPVIRLTADTAPLAICRTALIAAVEPEAGRV